MPVQDGDSGMELSRRSLASTRVTVALTLLSGVLSVAAGIADIGAPGQFGPLAPFIPPGIQQAAGFTGALTGFVLIGAALGLRSGLRASWYVAAVLLPVTLAQGFVQASAYSLPLIATSVVAIVAVWLSRDNFTRRMSLTTTQLAAGLALAGVQLYGTVGAFALREHFGGIDTVLDAFWFTLVTASTVGYGDVTPTSQLGRLFGISVLLLGTASFAIALTALLGPVIEARFASALGRMTQSQLEALEGHVIVAGYGDLTEPILGELTADARPFVVVVADEATASQLRERDLNVVVGDPSDDETFERVGLHKAAAVVVATNNDGNDALTILTARQLNPEVRIVASATERENERKLRRAGADTVISPAVIGGHLIVKSATGSDDAEAIAEDVLERQLDD